MKNKRRYMFALILFGFLLTQSDNYKKEQIDLIKDRSAPEITSRKLARSNPFE